MIYCGALDHDMPYWTNHWEMGIVPLGSITATPVATDSTANGNNGTVNGAMERPSIVSAGATFISANTQDINAGNGASLGITSDLTISAWVQFHEDIAGGSQMLIVSKDKNTGGRAYDLEIYGNSSGIFGATGNVPRFYLSGGAASDANGNNIIGSDVALSERTWYHITGVYHAAAGTLDMYVNGVSARAQRTGESTSIPVATANCRIGSREYAGFESYLDGKIDEVRISNSARSAGWILTEYNNQNNPAGFITIGTETS